MKKLFRLRGLFLMMTLLALSFSCEKEKEKESPNLGFKVTSDNYQVSDLGGVVYLQVVSTMEWEILPVDEPWIKVTKEDNDMLTLKLEPSGEITTRETTVTIKDINGELSASIKIIQDKVSTPRVEINNGKEEIKFLSLNGDARDVELIINANANWSVTSSSEWMKTNVTSGTIGSTTLVLSVQTNDINPRDGELIFNVEGGEPISLSVAQNGKNISFDSPTHYFYVTFGTMPTLYAGLHALSHSKPSFFAYGRQNTFDPEMFPPHITLSVANGPDEVQVVMRDYMKKKIMDIREREPNAIFGLYVDDLRARIGYDWFVEQGIDSSRVKVTLLSDGTGTYGLFTNVTDVRWGNIVNEVEALNWNVNTNKIEPRLPEFESGDWEYYMATLPNYRLLLQDGNLLEPSSQFMGEQLKKMNLLSVTPLQLLKNLTVKRQETFYKMASFDKAKFAAIFDKSSKKNLVIIGTYTGSNGEPQIKYVEKIVNKYGSEYDIFFKPHPADPNSKDFETRFPGLTLFPGQMPFEIFVWSLMDKIDMIGGYSSTVFLTVPVEKVRFIFGNSSASELIKPLNILFKNAEIEWIN